MAVLQRLQLINEGKYRAGLDSLSLTLNTYFDRITRDITKRIPILKNVYATGNLTNHASNNYLTAPTDMRQPEHMKAGASSTEVFVLEPEIFDSYVLSFGVASVPTKAKWVPADAKIYLNPFPSSGTATAYYLWYNKYHPVATGDTYLHLLGEEFDETITLGIGFYACQLAGKYDKMEWFRQSFEEDLLIKAANRLARMADIE